MLFWKTLHYRQIKEEDNIILRGRLRPTGPRKITDTAGGNLGRPQESVWYFRPGICGVGPHGDGGIPDRVGGALP